MITEAIEQTKAGPDNPFELANAAAYARWRANKLASYPREAAGLIVEVRDPRALTQDEKQRLLDVLRITNMVIYSSQLTDIEDKDIPRKLGEQFGLQHLDPNMLADDDGITSLSVVEGKFKRGYIPYSDKRLLWHTDGYYNTPAQQIRAFILHCVRPAPGEGGVNGLLDPEIAYIRLRDRNPAFVEALMQPDAMTIPANIESGVETRPAQSGPVFSLDSASASLHMRYTARTRSIEWADNPETRAAVEALEDVINNEKDYLFHYKLAAGQGLLANNVLHNRTAFEHDPAQARLIYRARYYDRIAGTGLAAV
jgi:hypothetical protein